MSIDPTAFAFAILDEGIHFVVGVPDSTLKELTAQFSEPSSAFSHHVAANEGNAVAEAVGAYFGTGEVPLVYMQNSGLGNAINPLLSLTHADVYGIPVVLLVGFRGWADGHDEPQHLPQGAATEPLLRILGIECRILGTDIDEARRNVKWAVQSSRTHSRPVALLAVPGSFDGFGGRSLLQVSGDPLDRPAAIASIVNTMPPDTRFVATTGFTARELWELRRRSHRSHEHDLLVVGSMGHASQIALGLAIARPRLPIVCIDGDGAAAMHLGGMVAITAQRPVNLIHVLLNNGVHDSVGGQPTVTGKAQVNFVEIARALKYQTSAGPLESEQQIRDALGQATSSPGPHFLELTVSGNGTTAAGRPDIAFTELKDRFMQALQVDDDE